MRFLTYHCERMTARRERGKRLCIGVLLGCSSSSSLAVLSFLTGPDRTGVGVYFIFYFASLGSVGAQLSH